MSVKCNDKRLYSKILVIWICSSLEGAMHSSNIQLSRFDCTCIGLSMSNVFSHVLPGNLYCRGHEWFALDVPSYLWPRGPAAASAAAQLHILPQPSVLNILKALRLDPQVCHRNSHNSYLLPEGDGITSSLVPQSTAYSRRCVSIPRCATRMNKHPRLVPVTRSRRLHILPQLSVRTIRKALRLDPQVRQRNRETLRLLPDADDFPAALTLHMFLC